jgi:hypothetical protein
MGIKLVLCLVISVSCYAVSDRFMQISQAIQSGEVEKVKELLSRAERMSPAQRSSELNEFRIAAQEVITVHEKHSWHWKDIAKFGGGTACGLLGSAYTLYVVGTIAEHWSAYKSSVSARDQQHWKEMIRNSFLFGGVGALIGGVGFFFARKGWNGQTQRDMLSRAREIQSLLQASKV